MEKLIPTVLVTLAIAVFSAHSIAATDHDAHGGHDAAHASAAAEAPPVTEPVQKIDKPAGKVTTPLGVAVNAKKHSSHSESASSDGHAHEHTDAK
jgi:Cu/Ag efflux protein CusF